MHQQIPNINKYRKSSQLPMMINPSNMVGLTKDFRMVLMLFEVHTVNFRMNPICIKQTEDKVIWAESWQTCQEIRETLGDL